MGRRPDVLNAFARLDTTLRFKGILPLELFQKAGETVKAFVTYKPFRGEEQILSTDFTLPSLFSFTTAMSPPNLLLLFQDP